MYNFVDIIWWYNSLLFFCYYNFFSDKGFRFWPKKSFRALVGTIGLHSISGTSFMSMVIKGMISITNEDRQLLSSLAILIIHLTARLIKEIPGLVCKPIVPTIAQKDFFGQNLKPFYASAPKVPEALCFRVVRPSGFPSGFFRLRDNSSIT